MTPLRILVATGIFPPDPGGPASYVPRIARALAERGHEVEVVTLSDRLDHDDAAFGVPVLRLARGQMKLLRGMRTWRALAARARAADVLFVNGLSGEAAWAARATGTPTVHKIVGDYAWERAVRLGWTHDGIDAYQRSSKPLRLRLLDALRTGPLRDAGAVIVPSGYLGAMVAGWGIPRERVHVVYNALPPVSARADGAPVGPPVITTVCRLVPWKGVDVLIDAVARLPDAVLEVIGEGTERAALEARARACGIADRVRFLGLLPQPEVHRRLAASSVFALASSYEGLPHVVLEAMAVGVPVVATAAGGTPEVVVHETTGLLVPVGDVSALHAALARVLDQRALAMRLVDGGAALLAERFTWHGLVDRTEALLVEVAARGRG